MLFQDLTFKFTFGNEIKRIHLLNVAIPSFKALQKMCCGAFDLKETKIDIKYKDDEGDVISVMTDDDVAEAVRITTLLKKTTTSFALVKQENEQQSTVAESSNIVNPPSSSCLVSSSSSSSSVSTPSSVASSSSSSSAIQQSQPETNLQIATRSIMQFSPVSFRHPRTPDTIVDPTHQRDFATLFQNHATKTAEFAVALKQIDAGEFWKCIFYHLPNTLSTLKRFEEASPKWALRAYGRQLLARYYDDLSKLARERSEQHRALISVSSLFNYVQDCKKRQTYFHDILDNIREIEDACCFSVVSDETVPGFLTVSDGIVKSDSTIVLGCPSSSASGMTITGDLRVGGVINGTPVCAS